jgi:hypothetical protein
MIEIKDHPNEPQPYWEVFGIDDSETPEKINYYPDGLGGFDRANALRQIIETHGENGHRIIK